MRNLALPRIVLVAVAVASSLALQLGQLRPEDLGMLRCLAREMRKKGKTSAEIPSETRGEQLIEHELYYGMCTSGWGSRRMQPDNPSQQQLTKATP